MSLKISAKTEYACIAIMELAIHKNSMEPVRIRNIAERHSVPPRFLVQILLQLKSADIVESTRGATGGYRLKKSPEEVTLGQVMNIIEAPPNNGKRMPNQTNAESEAATVLNNIWNDAEKCRHDFLNKITFADLIKNVDQFGQ
ncbi:MAG: Rrf2 family transcriptional regulator [Planctomycetaceae bacterium]|jgi:Rrf2 family protein|nr:Rrf2 family transcriptional regulator [Planctomycetaceae bacterium]